VNLVVNAIQAMPQGGKVTIETRRDKDSAWLIVSDTGCGMTDAVRQNIFTPFFTTKDVNEGTGLGLAVVHGIIASHNGHIRVQSAPGKGSRFDVELPVDGLSEKGGA
jgi:two-component system NtrC family sensor kinase